MTTLEEAVAAAERAQAEVLRLRREIEGYEERLGNLMRRVDHLESVERRMQNALSLEYHV